MEGLTVHCMVRNEPFVYYAVNSVYDYVDRILLYDTGSYDKHTLEDIDKLLAEDTKDKILYKNIVMDVDEVNWNMGSFRQMAKENFGKKGTWWVRQMMIDDTDTEFFMILDGDEIHYRQTMTRILEEIQDWDYDMICSMIPLTWFSDIDKVFMDTASGRIFLTDKIGMTNFSPGEMHTNKETNQIIRGLQQGMYPMKDVQPYAHFEKMLKPWRRVIEKEFSFFNDLPEVMRLDISIVERFLNERELVNSKAD